MLLHFDRPTPFFADAAIASPHMRRATESRQGPSSLQYCCNRLTDPGRMAKQTSDISDNILTQFPVRGAKLNFLLSYTICHSDTGRMAHLSGRQTANMPTRSAHYLLSTCHCSIFRLAFAIFLSVAATRANLASLFKVLFVERPTNPAIKKES